MKKTITAMCDDGQFLVIERDGLTIKLKVLDAGEVVVAMATINADAAITLGHSLHMMALDGVIAAERSQGD